MRAYTVGVMCAWGRGPCVPEEPTGPGNSWVFVGQQEGLRTPSLVILKGGVCVSIHTHTHAHARAHTERTTEGVFVCERAIKKLAKEKGGK